MGVSKCVGNHEGREHTVVKVTISSLRTKDEEASDGEVGDDSGGTEVPHQRVSDEIDLVVVFHPEVLEAQNVNTRCQGRKEENTHDTTTKARPRIRSRVIRMTISKASIRSPHNLLQLPELGKEARNTVVDLWRVVGNYLTSASAFEKQKRNNVRFEFDAVSINHNELSLTAFLLQVTSCCS